MKNKAWVIVILGFMLAFFAWQNTMSSGQKKVDKALVDLTGDADTKSAPQESGVDDLNSLCPIDIVPGVGIGKFKMGVPPDPEAIKASPSGFPLHYTHGQTIGAVEIVRLQLMPDCLVIKGKKLSKTATFDEVVSNFENCVPSKTRDGKNLTKCAGNVKIIEEGPANNGVIPAGIAISLFPEEKK